MKTPAPGATDQGNDTANTEENAMYHNATTGPLNRAQLSRLLEILKPYRTQPINQAVIALAARIARAEA